MVSSTPRPHFTPGKDPVPILQEAGWVPGPFWTGGKSSSHRHSIPDRPARSQSLYRLSYQAHPLHVVANAMSDAMFAPPPCMFSWFTQDRLAFAFVIGVTPRRQTMVQGSSTFKFIKKRNHAF